MFSAIATGPQDAVLSGPIIAALLIAVAAGLILVLLAVLSAPAPGLPLVRGWPARASPRARAGGGGRQVSVQARGVSTSRTMLGSLLFVFGFGFVFTSYGALFGTLGRVLTEHQETLIRVSGAVTIVMGLAFAGALTFVPVLNRR